MKHLAFNIGLLLALLFSSQSMLAAVEFESDNIKFTVTNAGDLTCAVSGLTDSGKEMESIQIPETVEFLNKNFTVTAIDRYAFTENKTVKNIALPTSVTSIGEYAFNECSNLSEINLPDNISTIGRYSFAECTSLNEIILLMFSINHPSINFLSMRLLIVSVRKPLLLLLFRKCTYHQ